MSDSTSELTVADPEALGMSSERLERLDTHMKAYVDKGLLPGWQVVISRGGSVVHHTCYGQRNIGSGVPWTDDTIVRLFSMTKPLTSVAAMMLYEQGMFELKDPVSKFLPEFADARVYREGNPVRTVTEGLTEPMLIWHLLTHTSGLTYGFHHQQVTDAIYRANGYEWGVPPGTDLAGACADWARMPLAFQPGTEWLYGVSTDVLGRVVEVISGQSLDEFFRTNITGPVGMVDTEFWVDSERWDRTAELYVQNPADRKAMVSPLRFDTTDRPTFLSGGGGLWGTAADYVRFCHMLLDNGVTSDGTRLLGTRTVEYMTQNHLPGGADLEDFGRPLFSETQFTGVGFGLGFSVALDPIANKVLGSPGEYAWGGAASTAFWCDPLEELAVVFLTQMLPSSTYPLRTQLKQLTYQAIID